MSSPRLPVPNSTTSFWRSQTLELDNHRTTPELPAEADLVVIGAGYAGTSTVYHLLQLCAQQGTPVPSIVMLEARELCSGATGRNGGQLKPDPYVRPAAVAATHGVAAAVECAAFERAHVPAIKAVVEAEQLDCDFVLTRCCDVALSDAGAAQMRASLAVLRATGVPSLLDDVYSCCADPAAAEHLSGVKGARACITYTAGHLYPYKLVHGLLRKAIAEHGVNLQTHTPVTAPVPAAPDASGAIPITTARGVIRARKVVFATNAYTATVLPPYRGRIVPVRGICSHIAAPATATASAAAATRALPSLPYSYILRSSPHTYEYLIPRLDGSIVVGGARSEYLHALDTWYDTVNDDALIEPAAHYFDGYMQRRFRGWEASGAVTDRVWTGIMGYSSDNMPHVGPVPGRHNQFIVAGFTGHGMPQVFLSAKAVAAMVLNGTPFAQTGVPRLYETTQARLDATTNTSLDLWKASLKPPEAHLSSAKNLLNPVHIGDVLHQRYRIVDKLGNGGYLTVWLAHDGEAAAQHRYVVLKIATAESGDQAATQSSHPDRRLLPSVLEVFRVTGPNGTHACYTTEPARDNMREACATRLFNLPVACALAGGLAQAVAYIHSQGYVDGDTYSGIYLHLHNVLVQLPLNFEKGVQKWRRQDGVDVFAGNEAAAFLALIHGMVVYEPADRLTIEGVLQSEWMQRWALPAFEAGSHLEAAAS